MLPNGVIGIRREDITDWERRAPLTPDHVRALVSQGVKFIVQPSYKRCFPDSAYAEAGAELNEDLSGAATIVGVKTVPAPLVIPERSYVFFSHTIKGQPDNMHLLDTLQARNCRLLDYECITEGGVKGGRRLVAFGSYAGMAGMVDFFHGLGQRLLMLGYSTPFLKIAQSFTYRSVKEASTAVEAAGKEIARFGLPDEISPLTFVFTGRGNVSKGAQSIFNLMPHRYVAPSTFGDEDAMFEGQSRVYRQFQLIGCVVGAEHFMQRKEDGLFAREEYLSNPEKYVSTFHEKFLPFSSVVVNGIYWEPRFPRIISNAHLKELRRSGNHKLVGICEITCDLDGSVEALQQYTSIDEPFVVFNPESNESEPGVRGEGVLIIGVDQLPTEFAEDASHHFGELLSHFIPHLAKVKENSVATNLIEQTEELPAPLRGATISVGGALTDQWKVISELRAVAEDRARQTLESPNRFGKQSPITRRPTDGDGETVPLLGSVLHSLATHLPVNPRTVCQKVLILGAGHVCPPVVEYLSRASATYGATVCSVLFEEAHAIATRFGSHASAVRLDVSAIEDLPLLEQLISTHDVVLSLVPAPFHPVVAKACLRLNTHLVTASYVSPELAALHEEAKEKNLIFLNEMGLDPGLDHISAMHVLNVIKRKYKGTVTSFSSVCGGLPAPEAANNPLRYKFSWAPRGVLTAAQNSAQYLDEGKVVQVKGEDLMQSAQPFDVGMPFALECIPNRDSLPYGDMYNLTNDHPVHVFRGTLRYAGFCDVMGALIRLGLADQHTVYPQFAEHVPWPICVARVLARNFNNTTCEAMLTCEGEDVFKNAPLVAQQVQNTLRDTLHMNESQVKYVMNALHWLELFVPNHYTVPQKSNTMIDILCYLLQRKLQFKRHEKDVAIMCHKVKYTLPNGQKRKVRSTLCVYGDEHFSAMARTVGYTAAAAVDLVLQNAIQERGVLRPMDVTDIEHVLDMCKPLGIQFHEEDEEDAV